MKNIDLYKILKGHEGESFYCSLLGENVILHTISENRIYFLGKKGIISIASNGAHSDYPNGECIIFPSKNQRSWEKLEGKIPKVWEDIPQYIKNTVRQSFNIPEGTMTTSEKAALSILKIRSLIELGYGGNVLKEDKNTDITCETYYIYPINCGTEIEWTVEICLKDLRSPIMFTAKTYAKEFLTYPENIQLLKDFFMLK